MATHPDRPSWLNDESEIIGLLNAVADRFDQQSGEMRTRRIHVQAERYLKPLRRLDESGCLFRVCIKRTRS